MADGNVHQFPRKPILRVHEQHNAYGFPPVDAVERYDLHGTLDGYVIRDRGEVICRFHGPHFELASKTLRLLQADDELPEPPPPQAA